jgi:hypothetical protein
MSSLLITRGKPSHLFGTTKDQ